VHCSHAPPVEALKSNQSSCQALPGGYVGALLRNGVVDATVSALAPVVALTVWLGPETLPDGSIALTLNS
jgi:hypothetical protein